MHSHEPDEETMQGKLWKASILASGLVLFLANAPGGVATGQTVSDDRVDTDGQAITGHKIVSSGEPSSGGILHHQTDPEEALGLRARGSHGRQGTHSQHLLARGRREQLVGSK